MTLASSSLKTAYGTFHLSCYPSRPAEPLLAWCSADRLLLEEAYQLNKPSSDILVINDMHGALSVALQPRALWTDSALSALALRHNEQANHRAPTDIVWSTQVPAFTANLVILRIPKQSQYFEYQLARLSRLLPEGATLLAAGMDKHLSARTADTLERFIGPTQRHRGQQKARLFSAVRDERRVQAIPEATFYYCDALAAELQALPNVFSQEKLDIGTRFLLEQLPHIPPGETLIDLACGNGVIGLAAFKHALASKISFCDESAMAISSARANASSLFGNENKQFSYHHGDGLRDYNEGTAQIIVCNPPFHLQHTVDEFAGRHLLNQCSAHLEPGGRLYLVANKHLNYVPTLKRKFKRVEKIAANSKFNVLVAQKP